MKNLTKVQETSLVNGIIAKITAFKAQGKISKKTGKPLVGLLGKTIGCYPYLQEIFEFTPQESYDYIEKLSMNSGFKVVRAGIYGSLLLLNEDKLTYAKKADKAKVDKYASFK